MFNRAVKLFGDAKLRTKLILSYLIVVMLPIMFIGYFFIDRTKDAVMEQTDSINKISFDQMKNNIYNQLHTYLTFSDNAFTQDNIIQYLSTKLDDDYTDMDRFLAYSRFKEIFLLKFGNNKENAKVEFYTSNRSIIQDENYIYYIKDDLTTQKWYTDALNSYGGNSINLECNESGKQFLINFSRLVRATTSNKYITVLKITIPEEYIFKLMENEGKNKRIYLLDNKNNIISSTDRENVGKNISEVSVFNQIKLKRYPQNQVERVEIDRENCVINIGCYNDKSAIDEWKVVSIISSDVLAKKMDEIVKYGLVICSISIMITIIFVLLFSNKLTKRLRLLAHNMGKVSNGRFEVLVSSNSKDEIGELTNGFKKMVDRINSLIEEVYKSEVRVKDLIIKKKEAEIHALQSQINPHFLFNTMESIRMNLLKKKDRETASIIQSFSKLLRKSIDWSKEMITLKQELDFVETYLVIQKYRYRDKFDYKFEVEEDLYKYLVPKFSLQPIVENSIFHGMEMKEENGLLKICASRVEEGMKIIISDDGIGIEPNKLEELRQRLAEAKNLESSIGIINVNQRIKLNYGEKYGITIDSIYGLGTSVAIILPLQCEDEM